MDFSVDMDNINDVIDVYDKSIKLLKENLNILNKSLKTIDNTGWSGQAKEQFITIKYGEWEKGIKEHISRLEFLVSMLKEGRSEFEELERMGSNL
ncbi:WXG100 family type VII secretion target [Paraclostridium ghonii]|uniref:WXG100 family type VII secretion target n=1 Tax=Paraclostridium ghonii TaxID=29358 RepID=UPI00202CB02C|nr:WXG100 family type VII secretion target [Paeniclostridium ghonii]MCM0167871.1 WXG100 family type VII secretion target [Paeniclostridium ghonii]